ncbi:hypothetical protein SAMN05518854_11574 [Variovorax sp. YR266]|uniref:hypothetical protein n=1 Tax=Variovorax sp. YR266 TaxID=1884386 RepID=UPI000897FAAE|nr:hypothetical protein [Variovorax sp. YR266]SDZ70766.1 hypothetical protein SAMN05518854_11574 [Variovorax sp. YR266]
MSTGFFYHPDADAEFNAIRPLGPYFRKCLAVSARRGNWIADGTRPLLSSELLKRGRSLSTLYLVDYWVLDIPPRLFDWITVVYDQVGADVIVVAIDACRGGVRIHPLPTLPDASDRGYALSR